MAIEKTCTSCKKCLPEKCFYLQPWINEEDEKVFYRWNKCKECVCLDRKKNKDRANCLRRRYRRSYTSKKRLYKIRTEEQKKEYKKRCNQAEKARNKYMGFVSVKTVQKVYEDNIKKNGTLTCYLCLKPIEFGKDTLEHIVPYSKGGDNSYENLSIACKSCNCKKGTKTLEEFLISKKRNSHGI